MYGLEPAIRATVFWPYFSLYSIQDHLKILVVMLQTFKAQLRGRHLDWVNDEPLYPKQQPVIVHVTFVEEGTRLSSSKRAQMAALEKLAHLKGRKMIADPIAWQKEQRRDRENIRGK